MNDSTVRYHLLTQMEQLIGESVFKKVYSIASALDGMESDDSTVRTTHHLQGTETVRDVLMALMELEQFVRDYKALEGLSTQPIYSTGEIYERYKFNCARIDLPVLLQSPTCPHCQCDVMAVESEAIMDYGYGEIQECPKCHGTFV